jgi:hypothetical protein
MNLQWISVSEIEKLFNLPENESENFKYFNPRFIDNDLLLVSLENNKITGILQVGNAPKKDKLFWMKYICVHHEHRQNEISKILLNEMCHKLSQIEDAQIDLSTYEKDGEVLINTVISVASQFPNLSVNHRIWGGPYQSAKNDFIRIGDEVVFIDDNSNQRTIGQVCHFEDFSEPAQVWIKTNQDKILIELSKVKKNK